MSQLKAENFDNCLIILKTIVLDLHVFGHKVKNTIDPVIFLHLISTSLFLKTCGN